MSTASSRVRRRRGTAVGPTLASAELWLLRMAWAALVVVAALVLVRPSLFGLAPILADADRLLAAMAIYLLSHVARFARLALLIAHPGLRARRVLQVHLLTAGLGVLLPFKLGELVRIREVGVITHSLRRGLLTVWLERALDACVLLLIVLVIAIEAPDSLGVLTPFLILMTAFVTVTVVLLAVVPENLRGLMLHIVRRPSGERSVDALRLLRAALDTLHEAPAMLRGRVPTLVLLSAGIWIAEVAVVSLALPGADLGLSGLSTGMLSLLASVSSGATVLTESFAGRLGETLAALGRVTDADLYRLCLSLPLLVGGAVAATLYVPWRGRRRGPAER